MSFSRIGFGAYRISIENEEHERALRKALLLGINLIDTSANYTDGNSEALIGKVIKEIKDRIDRKQITIVSKFGYIQGQNMKRYREGFVTPETVEYSPDCFHCIHPTFMRDQLSRSLERLQTDYIDIYLIHNPEYYLLKTLKSEADRKDREKQQKEMLRRIGVAFVALEEEVKKDQSEHMA